MIDLGRVETILAFFAHPDDETLAAGATIAKLTRRGVDVHIAIPATGVHSRRNVKEAKEMRSDLIELRRDCEKAISTLGVTSSNLYFGNFPDNEMDKHALLEIVHWLEAITGKVKPEIIFTHHRCCTNIDHQYCHEAAVVATRPALNNHITLICGEVPSSTGYLKPSGWEPNFYIEVAENEVEAKIRAMESYRGEAKPDPHPRSREVLKALAKVRGSESGFHYAEAFMIQQTFG